MSAQAWPESPAALHDREKVTGRQRYLSEWQLPGALHAVVVRSPYPRARLTSVDLQGALAMPGVVAVHTAEDLPATLFNPAGEPPDEQLEASADRTLLTDEPRHLGDGLAVVLATTAAAGRAAAQAIRMEWEPRQHVSDAADGLVIGELSWGEPADAALASAEVLVEATYRTQAVQHMCLEPHACAATFEPGRASLTVWTNSQTPSDVRRICCEVLDLPMTALHVRKVNEGGGFGAKQEVYEEPLVAWLALRHRRPVQLAYDRTEEFVAGRSRHASEVRVRLGASADGTITAMDVEARIDSGAYASHAAFVLGNVLCAGYYTYPNAVHHVAGTLVRTNNLPGGAYRGYGAPQALFAVEQAVDELAVAVGRDPVALRVQNATAEEHPLFGAAPARLARLLDMGRAAAGWEEGQPDTDDLRAGRGVAIATMLNTASDDPHEHTTAIVRLNEDGTATLSTGTVDCGTGSSAALASLVARELSIEPRAVEVCEGDTAAGLADLGSFSQRSIFVGGGAALAAARRLRGTILAEAGASTGVTPLSLVDGRVRDEHGKVDLPLSDVARWAVSRGAVLAAETYAPDASPPSYCACFADVTVDEVTGCVVVRRLTAAVDCGTVLNLAAVRGQVIGAVAQGLGFALYEDLRPPGSVDPVTTLEAHGVALAGDVPEVRVVLLDEPDEGGPLGAKGVGEVAISPVAPAIANAVAAATGVRFRSLPLRPGTVWSVLQGAP